MKKVILLFTLFVVGTTFAQDVREVTSKNSWFKIGMNAGVPIGDASDRSAVTVGLDLKGQFLVTPNFGIGLASGYTHFISKDGYDDFGVIPAAGFARYYFKPKGLFLGVDVGYGFLTNMGNNDGGPNNNGGGLYVNPQIGYHNRDWNFFAYYQNTFAENDFDIKVLGIGATYNLRF